MNTPTYCPPLVPTVIEEMTVEQGLGGLQAKLRVQGATYILDCVIANTPREYLGKNLLDLIARAHHDAATAAHKDAA